MGALVCVVRRWAGAIGLSVLVVSVTAASAQARYRYPPRIPFDPRPALSQATVGALSLGVLAAGAEEALACDCDGYAPPLIGCPPPLGYEIYP